MRIRTRPEANTQQRLKWWLLLLKPGQHMEFDPADLGVKPDSIQDYVHRISLEGARKYRYFHTGSTGPVTVRYIGERS